MVNGKEMVNTFYAQVKRFRKAPVIEHSSFQNTFDPIDSSKTTGTYTRISI